MRFLGWPASRGAGMKNALISAVGSDLFNRSSRGSSTSIAITDGPSPGSGGSEAANVFILLGLGAGSRASSDAVGESTIILSTEAELDIA